MYTHYISIYTIYIQILHLPGDFFFSPMVPDGPQRFEEWTHLAWEFHLFSLEKLLMAEILAPLRYEEYSIWAGIWKPRVWSPKKYINSCLFSTSTAALASASKPPKHSPNQSTADFENGSRRASDLQQQVLGQPLPEHEHLRCCKSYGQNSGNTFRLEKPGSGWLLDPFNRNQKRKPGVFDRNVSN